MPRPATPATLRHLVLQVLPMLALLTMPLLFQAAPRAAAQTSEGSVRLSPAMSTVPADDGPFTVYVVLENLEHFGQVSYDDNRDGTPDRFTPSDGLAAFQFTIDYDAAIVEVQSVEPGPDIGRTGRSFQCLPVARDPGAVTFGCLSLGSAPAGAQGTLTLASMQLTPRSTGLSPLVISVEIAGPLGDSAQVDVGGGAVRVSGAGPGGVPTRTATVAPGTPSVPPSGRTRSPTALPGATTLEKATATSTPSGTAIHPATPTVRGQSTPPASIDHRGDSKSSVWAWSLGIAGALAIAALGLGGVLWRRRAQGGR